MYKLVPVDHVGTFYIAAPKIMHTNAPNIF